MVFEALKTAPAWLVKAREPVSRLRSWRLGSGPARVWGGGLQRHGMGSVSFLCHGDLYPLESLLWVAQAQQGVPTRPTNEVGGR